MRFSKSVVMAVLAVGLTAGTAAGDWDPGMPHKMHYPQLPDLTPTGLDVLDTWSYSGAGGAVPPGTAKFLADDWRCTGTGLVTDIHFWGSWLGDSEGLDQNFILKIYADVPASQSPEGYSMPGTLLWQSPIRPPDQMRPYATGLTEGFYDPNVDQVVGDDTICWQYNYFFDEDVAFRQEEDNIYWLSVEAYYEEADLHAWGWKTTNPIETQHFLDDAVYWDIFPDGTGTIPMELRYPLGHPFEAESMDLAFVITPEPATLALMGLGAAGLAVRRLRRRR